MTRINSHAIVTVLATLLLASYWGAFAMNVTGNL